MKNVKIINYFSGNIFSVTKAFEHFGCGVEIISSPEKLKESDFLVLPGVGAFGNGMEALRKTGMDQGILEFVKTGRPFIGICLGMQLLFTSSEEFGFHEGLDIIKGKVLKLPDQEDMKIPHIGWKKLEIPDGQPSNFWNDGIFSSYDGSKDMYFIHSFAGNPERSEDWLSKTFFGKHAFCSAVRRENVWGCQFHPEKSGNAGLAIIEKFLEM